MTLDFYLNVIIAGVLTGSVYGLMALGLSLIFGVMHVVNFAHGEMMVTGMYVAFIVHTVFGMDGIVNAATLAARSERRDIFIGV